MPRNIENRIYNLTAPDASDIECTCPTCGAVDYVTVTEEEGDRLIDGELIQDVLPHRSIVERERIISGMCPTCQELLVPAE